MRLPVMNCWIFASLLFIPLCQSLTIPSLESNNVSRSLNSSHLGSLPAVPDNFQVTPSTAGTSFQANAMEITHLFFLILIEAWNYNGPTRYLPPRGQDFLDPSYERTLNALIFPAQYMTYGTVTSVGWAGVRILEAQINAMDDDDVKWDLPARGWRIMVGSDTIGVISIKRQNTLGEKATESSIDSGHQSSNGTAPSGLVAPLLSGNSTTTSLQATGYHCKMTQLSRAKISRRFVLVLLLDYLATLFHYDDGETVAQYHRRGSKYRSESVGGLQLEVNYLLLQHLGNEVKWLDIMQASRFVLQGLASQPVVRAFSGRVNFMDSNNAFVEFKIFSARSTSEDPFSRKA